MADALRPTLPRVDLDHGQRDGTLEVEGTATDLHEGHALFVEAGAEHRFTGYEGLSLLVIFARKQA